MTEISDWSDIETQLQETKELLLEIEQRFHQIQRDSMEQKELQQQQQQIRSQIQEDSGDRNNSKIRRKPSSNNGISNPDSHSHKDTLQKQLQEISDRLEQIEGDLESRLLSWSSFREPFWQIVRFGGIGIIIGVILKSCAG